MTGSSDSAPEITESEYYRFREFDHANAEQVLKYYVKYFTESPVLELACGTGVFLDLLREAGIASTGVDIDDGMVSACRDKGHDVVLGDAVAHLRTVPDASQGGLFAAHFIEHLTADVAQQVYDEAARILRPGGVFVAVVPNAACHSIMAYDFWRDPTHVRPYDPVALSFFAETAGLETAESGSNPNNHPGPPPWLHHDYYTADVDLGGSIGEYVRMAQGELTSISESRRRGDPVAAAMSEILARFGHLVAVLSDQVDALQKANALLLDELYPANEVYVIARKPIGSSSTDPAPNPRGTDS